MALLRIAAESIDLTRKRAGETARQVWFRKVFLTPRYWSAWFRRSMRSKMDANPLIWLEYRTAWSRSGRWMLLAALIFAESYVLAVEPLQHLYFALQPAAAFAILLVLSVTAASSFLREKESGAFELLLVAPFTERSLLGGRLRAVWSYYWPHGAMLLLFVGIGIFLNGSVLYNLDFDGETIWVARFLSLGLSAITIPVLGLYFALRMRSFLATVAATVLAGLFGPLYVWQFLTRLAWYANLHLDNWFLPAIFDPGTFPYINATLATHVLLVFIFSLKAHELLRSRRFV
jgi:hypothetical protein